MDRRETSQAAAGGRNRQVDEQLGIVDFAGRSAAQHQAQARLRLAERELLDRSIEEDEARAAVVACGGPVGGSRLAAEQALEPVRIGVDQCRRLELHDLEPGRGTADRGSVGAVEHRRARRARERPAIEPDRQHVGTVEAAHRSGPERFDELADRRAPLEHLPRRVAGLRRAESDRHRPRPWLRECRDPRRERHLAADKQRQVEEHHLGRRRNGRIPRR